MRLTRVLALVATATLATTAVAGHTSAITGGTIDGETHPNVGMLLFYTEAGRFRCSGTLMTPTVVLTAAHCTAGTVGKTMVTFATTVADGPPSGLPVAANPAAGFVGTETAPSGITVHYGTAHTAPRYSDFTDIDNWNDYGVVVLDAAILTIEPAELAPLGYVDQFAQPALNHTIFTSVGYGSEVRKPVAGPQKPTPQTFPLVRRFADQPGQKLTPQIVQVNGNINDPRGTGGTCFGDSGGPSFLGGYVVTVTSYGYTSNCRYLGGLQRVDIGVAQAWLATFGVTPAP